MSALLLLYAVFTLAILAAVFFAVDLLAKAGKRKNAADLSQGDILAVGLVLTLGVIVAILSVMAFRLEWFAWFAGAALLAFFAAYAARVRRGRRDEALLFTMNSEEEGQLRRVLEADQENAAAWERLSVLLEQGGDFPGAIKCRRKIAELEPGEASRARLEALQGRAREALRG